MSAGAAPVAASAAAAIRAALGVLALLFSVPAGAQPPRRDVFQTQLAASVVSAALAFIAPRAIEAVTVQQLALWGLGAPAAFDPALSTELREGELLLLRGDGVIYRRPVPPGGTGAPAPGGPPATGAAGQGAARAPPAEPDAAEAWGTAAAEVLRAAVAASPALQAQGTAGVLGGFFDEMFNHLDPYSRYVPPGAAGADRARRSGEAGAGVSIRPGARGLFVVTDVNGDGPGAEAGIRTGDVITKVDDQPVAGESLETVQGWLAGLEGTAVRITLRPRRGREQTVELERAVTPPETVFARRLGDLLVVRITGFSADTDERLAREVELLAGARSRVRGLIIDLRGNRGGLLRQAVSATNLFLEGGIIATTAGRNPQAAHEWVASGGDVTGGRPIVVLVDGRTASAAEIMAAALSDRRRAVVVGSTTLGKGLVQTIATLPDDGELFVSWSRVLAPRGWPLQGLGVLPQVCTSLGQPAMQQQLAALDSGVQPMAAALAAHAAARAPLPASAALALRTPCPAAGAREADVAAARYLLTHPTAFQTALMPP